MSPKEFYDRMRAGARVSTLGCVARSLYRVLYRVRQRGHAHGLPVLYLGAVVELQLLRARRQMPCAPSIPTLSSTWSITPLPCATGALLALEAVRQRSAGLTAKQLVDWANEAKDLRARLLYARELRRTAAGGCIPPAAAQLTAKLDVKPELPTTWPARCRRSALTAAARRHLKSILKSFRENYVPDRTMPIAIADG